jgi:hypothetical protein
MKVAEPYQAWAVDSQKACETEFPSFPSGRAEPARARPHRTFQCGDPTPSHGPETLGSQPRNTGGCALWLGAIEAASRECAPWDLAPEGGLQLAVGVIGRWRPSLTLSFGANVWHGALPARLVSAGLLKGEGK